jgi:hypothetical protein
LELLLGQRRKEAPPSEEGGSGVEDAAEAGAQGSEAEDVVAENQPLALTQASGTVLQGCLAYLAA